MIGLGNTLTHSSPSTEEVLKTLNILTGTPLYLAYPTADRILAVLQYGLSFADTLGS